MPPFTELTVRLLTDASVKVLTVGAAGGGYAAPLMEDTVKELMEAFES